MIARQRYEKISTVKAVNDEKCTAAMAISDYSAIDGPMAYRYCKVFTPKKK